jgi:hypothetical protein
VRATPVAAAAENGVVKLVRGRHSEDFLDELTAIPHGAHDDCLDALSGAHNQLSGRSRHRTAHSPHPPRAAPVVPQQAPTRPQTRRYADELAAFLGATYYAAPPLASGCLELGR